MTMGSDWSNDDATPEEHEALEVILEAARRANWDAVHGPAYLRSGRYFAQGTPTIAGDAGEQSSVLGSTKQRERGA